MNKYLHYAIVLLVSLVLTSFNFFDGFSQDLDGYLLMDRAKIFAETHQIIQSRTWGFPLYENLAYRIFVFFGLTGAKVLSLLFYLFSGLVFYKILDFLNHKNSTSNLLIALAFVSSPFLVISGNSFMETSQGVFFALLALLFYLKSKKEPKLFWFSVLFLAFASATRPDYVIFAFAIFASKILQQKRLDAITISQGVVYWIVFLFPFLFYTDFMLPMNLVSRNPIPIKIAKILLCYLSLFGILFFFILPFYLKNLLKDFLSKENPLLFVLPISIFFYTIRLWLIPDEVEYILILLPLVLICLAYKNQSLVFASLLWIAILLPNFIQLHFFERDFVGEIKKEVGFSKGAIIQDKNFRLQNEYIEGDMKNELQEISKMIDEKEFLFYASRNKKAWVLMPSQDLRMYTKGREHPDYYNNFGSQKVFVFPFPSHKGWKQFIKFESYQKVSKNPIYFVESIEPYKIKKVEF